ncbi:MAG: hypothetical protein EHM46_02220, partial [Bacteroidetes bacterium]
MRLRSISIRSRLLVAGVILLVFWAFMALFYMDGIYRLKEQEELLESRTGLLTRYASAVTSCAGLVAPGDQAGAAACAENLLQLEDLAGELASLPRVAEDEEARVLLRQILLLVEETGRKIRSGGPGEGPTSTTAAGNQAAGSTTGSQVPGTISGNQIPGTAAGTAELQLELLSSRMTELDRALDHIQYEYRQSGNRRTGIVLFLGIVLTGTWFFLFSGNLNRGFRSLLAFTGRLKEGSLPATTGNTGGDEFGRIAANLEEHAEDLGQKIRYIASLAGDTHKPIYTPHER